MIGGTGVESGILLQLYSEETPGWCEDALLRIKRQRHKKIFKIIV